MRILRAFLCVLTAALAAVLPFPVAASFHLFGIQQLYSNADGTIQFVVLKEMSGANGENFLGGHQLISTQGGTINTFTFPSNLPSSNTANRSVLIATPGLAALGMITPDYTMPAGFLFTNGGSVNYAGVDTVAYTALPTDGVNALNRDGSVGPNQAKNFAGATASIVAPPPPTTVAVIEYYHQGLDHYFMTALATDIATLDAGVPPGWARTGETFNAYSTQQPNTVPVCRFFIPPEHGSSHFFSAKAADCAFLLMAAADPVQFPSFSGYIQEDPAAFFVTLPDATGLCPAGTVPVFRLWNQRFDSNHRYTIKQAIVTQMQALNFVLEGDPPNRAAMCAAP